MRRACMGLLMRTYLVCSRDDEPLWLAFVADTSFKLVQGDGSFSSAIERFIGTLVDAATQLIEGRTLSIHRKVTKLYKGIYDNGYNGC